jgi:hypothetical protein
MKERPIIFSADSIRAIFEDRKTQSRRVIKPKWSRCLDFDEPEDVAKAIALCPYGQPGDRLWVRETFQVWQPWGSVDDEWIGDDTMPIDGPLGHDKPEAIGHGWQLAYKADCDYAVDWWRPSIFMPRWASRITLEIVSVRVERVREISDKDAVAEGFAVDVEDFIPSLRFAAYWDQLNHKRGYGFDVNPWVWVIEFKRLP